MTRFLLDSSRCNNLNQHRSILVQYTWLYRSLNRCIDTIDSSYVIRNVCVVLCVSMYSEENICSSTMHDLLWSWAEQVINITPKNNFHTMDCGTFGFQLMQIISFNLHATRYYFFKAPKSFDGKHSTFCMRFYSAYKSFNQLVFFKSNAWKPECFD